MARPLIEVVWYQVHPIRWLLYPFSLIYQAISQIRRWYLRSFKMYTSPIPVIVVGNLTVGGVGKTPLVIAIANALIARGIKVGIVSRGYGAKIRQFPYEVQKNSTAAEVGDEPLLIAEKTQCPVVIAPNRSQAVRYLLAHHVCQVIISDDGLQHYKLGRAIEIVVIDGLRKLGNGLCIPAGPLRETAKRLDSVDWVIVNGGPYPGAHRMELVPGEPVYLKTGKPMVPESLRGSIAAVAGIGNPSRFFNTLAAMDISFNAYSFPDHYQFQHSDFNYSEKTILMTEKDAVKCRTFASESMGYLPVEAKIDDTFWQGFWTHPSLKDLF